MPRCYPKLVVQDKLIKHALSGCPTREEPPTGVADPPSWINSTAGHLNLQCNTKPTAVISSPRLKWTHMLLSSHSARSAGTWSMPKNTHLTVARTCHPLTDRALVDAQRFGDLARGPVLPLEGPG